jgi:hypothetical protein
MHHPQTQPIVIAPAYSVLTRNEDCHDFSWTKELDHIFSRKFLNIAWWPVFKLRQNWRMDSAFFRNCRQLPGFENLWKTIQKGSFAYNTLFLGITPFHRSSTHLADVTTLALFFGDEFIDGICETAGKPLIRQLVNSGVSDFYMRKKVKNDFVQLEYLFDLKQMLPSEVMQTINPKYKITYNVFYDLLQTFLSLMNNGLCALPFEKAEVVADKIAAACNNCLDSYLHDVNCCPEQETTADTHKLLHFHETKTRHMQRKLLELRCVLAEKEYLMRNVEAQSWLDIMSVVQIYDDMQDVALDDGIQDNLVLCIARCHFPAEWKWFLANKQLLHSKNNALLLSLHMPCSIQACLQLITDKIKTMNWEQQKIMHYVLSKNWFIAIKDSEETIVKHKKRKPELLRSLYQKIKEQMPHLTTVHVKSYIIETCFLLAPVRKYILKKTRISVAYQLRYNLLSMSSEAKATVFDNITAN